MAKGRKRHEKKPLESDPENPDSPDAQSSAYVVADLSSLNLPTPDSVSSFPRLPRKRMARSKLTTASGLPVIQVALGKTDFAVPTHQVLPGQRHLLYPDDVAERFREVDPAGGVGFPTPVEIRDAKKKLKDRPVKPPDSRSFPVDPDDTDDPEDFVINERLVWCPSDNWRPNSIEYRMHVKFAVGASVLAITIDPVINPLGYPMEEVAKIVHTVGEFMRQRCPLNVSDFRMRRLQALMVASDQCWTEWDRSKSPKVETITSDGCVTTKISESLGSVAHLKAWKELQDSAAELIEQITDASSENGKLIPSAIGKTREQFQTEVSRRLIAYCERKISQVDGDGDGVAELPSNRN